MDAAGVALIITALTAMGAMLFTGYIAIRQLPEQSARIAEVHTIVNSKADVAAERITSLEAQIKLLNETALTKAEGREKP